MAEGVPKWNSYGYGDKPIIKSNFSVCVDQLCSISLSPIIHDGRAPKTKVHVDSGNPYGERPGSTKAQQDALAHLMKGLDDMDDPENRPEGLDLPSWERFCAARRTKVESEQMVCKVIF